MIIYSSVIDSSEQGVRFVRSLCEQCVEGGSSMMIMNVHACINDEWNSNWSGAYLVLYVMLSTNHEIAL